MTISSLEAALGYARLGWRVLPILADSKAPATEHGVHDATTDEAQIREWWRPNLRAGIGIATGAASKVWVLDVDGPEAMSWYDAQVIKHGLVHTLGVRTARGAHLYWRYPDGATVRNAQGIAPGVDVRGEGGYVCAPPTVHRSGHVYAWIHEPGFTRDAADAPAWLFDMVKEKPRPPVPKPVSIPRRTPWSRDAADRELARVLRLDPTARTTLGQQLGADIHTLHVRHVKCPQCADKSVWWTVSGPGHAKCSHLNSCGWHAPLHTLLS